MVSLLSGIAYREHGWFIAIRNSRCTLTDLRPENILLDRNRLKLSDFDCTAEIGTNYEAYMAPYGRILNSNGTDQGECGAFGFLSPRPEHFALGSFFYFINYGFEVHGDRCLTEDPYERGPKVVDLLQNYLGVDVLLRDGVYYLSQMSYLEKAFKHFGYQDLKPSTTPHNQKVVLKPRTDGNASPEEIKGYQESVGVLIWLSITVRFDIAFDVIQVSRFCQNPDSTHHTAVQHIYRYLRGYPDLAALFRLGPSVTPVPEDTESQLLYGYCDASWAGPHDADGRSTTGYVFKLAGGPISCSSKR
jgi:serine/threonine protein kinase